MGMTRLLHERLHDMFEGNPTGVDYLQVGDNHIELVCGDAETLANEIERYYLPKPLFNDGEPVLFGDCFGARHGMNQTVSSIHFTPKHFYINSKDSSGQFRYGDVVKRPHSEGFESGKSRCQDRDGKGIAAGDTLYDIRTNEPMVVLELPYDIDGTTKYGECVKVNVLGRMEVRNPHFLTHKKPAAVDADGQVVYKGALVWNIEGVQTDNPVWGQVLVVGDVSDDQVQTMSPVDGSPLQTKPAYDFSQTFPMFDRTGMRIAIGDVVYACGNPDPLDVKYFSDGEVVASSPSGELVAFDCSDLSHGCPTQDPLDSNGNVVEVGDIVWTLASFRPHQVLEVSGCRIRVVDEYGGKSWRDACDISVVIPTIDCDSQRVHVGDFVRARKHEGMFEVVDARGSILIANKVGSERQVILESKDIRKVDSPWGAFPITEGRE